MKTLTSMALLTALALLGACNGKTQGTLAFEPDSPTGSPTVSLRSTELGNGTMVIEVVGRGLTDVYGVAFRLQYDPAALRFVSMERGDGWPDGTATLSMARETVAGLTVAGLTLRADAQGDPAEDRVLARLTFDLMGGLSQVSFVPSRCGVVDSVGTQVPDVVWVGGELLKR